MKLFILNCNPTGTSGYSKILPCYSEQVFCHPELVSWSNDNRFRNKFGMTKDKAAFTLAEVLITLGIIGIVAAITIPMLMTKIGWTVRKTQYKKAVSVMNEALKLVYEKTDTIYSCYYGHSYSNSSYDGQTNSQCNELGTQMMQVLKVAHVCRGNAYNDGCIPKYKGIDSILKEDDDITDDELETWTTGCSGFKENNILNQNTAIVLMDGTIIGIYGAGSFNNLFFVDVNGMQKPNKWGYDVFAFMIMSDDTKLYLRQGGCLMIEKGGRTGSQMFK